MERHLQNVLMHLTVRESLKAVIKLIMEGLTCLGDNCCSPAHSEPFPSKQGSPFIVFRQSSTRSQKGHSVGPVIQNNELGSKNSEVT